MNLENKLTKLFKVNYPIIQAPMAGGITTSELIAAVSNAGGLGMIGAGYMTPSQIREQVKEIRQLTNQSFGINLFIPSKYSLRHVNKAKTWLKPIEEKLNMQNGYVSFPNEEKDIEKFQDQLKVVIEEKIPICSFTFGIPSKEAVSLLKEASIVLIGTATTVQEAILNEEAGMDAVVLQGSEAGGHRGTFVGSHYESLIGLMSLIPQVSDNVTIPLIAAGGIMDGRGVAAANCLGAQAVQMGTAFLSCKESGANQVYKDAILQSTEEMTVLTRAFTGKLARGIKNSFISETSNYENEIPDYPIQNLLTRELRKASTIQQNPEYMSLWSGQSPRLAKSQTVKELIDQIISEVTMIESNL